MLPSDVHPENAEAPIVVTELPRFTETRRVHWENAEVPIEVRPERRQTLGLRWLTQYTRARSERTMSERLAKELMDASNGLGASVKKKEDTHRMAEANRAFAHYRF